mgnify:CR=1 FL=1
MCGHVTQVAPGALRQGVAHVPGSCLQVGTCKAPTILVCQWLLQVCMAQVQDDAGGDAVATASAKSACAFVHPVMTSEKSSPSRQRNHSLCKVWILLETIRT